MLRLKYREYFSDAAYPGRVSIFDTIQNDKKEWDQPQAFKAEGRAGGGAFHDAGRYPPDAYILFAPGISSKTLT